MAKNKTLEPFFDESRKRWRLDIPATISSSGKRLRLSFKTRKQARDYVDKVSDKDIPASTIAPALAMKADEARQILSPWDLDLVQAARVVAEALAVLNGAGSILDAVKEFRASFDSCQASMPFGNAIAIYLDNRPKLRKTTRKSYEYTLEDVLRPLHSKNLAAIKATDLEALFKGKANTACAMHHRNLRAFWNWASKKPRQWADRKELESLEAPEISNEADIEILNAEEVKALMQAAEAESPAAAASYALAIFAGIRMNEFPQLLWGDINEESIEIGKRITKRSLRRNTPLCPTLIAWLDACRGDAKDTDPITPPNWVDVSKSVRRRAGWDVSARLLPENIQEIVPTKGNWPSNAPRHTCASVQVAIGTSLDDLKFKFGHTGTDEILRRHYVRRLLKREALAILSIGPDGSVVALESQSNASSTAA